MDTAAARQVEGRPYVPGIDGLRAVAVLSVMLFHLLPGALPGGFVGVDVFFVISGYVVTGSLQRDARLSFGRFIAAFYARRFKRIVPALLVCLGATVLLNAAWVPDAWLSQAVRATALSAFFGLSNFALTATNDGYFATRSEFNPFTHTWSLAVEEQFYVLFPLLAYLWIGERVTRWRRLARLLLIGLSLGSLLWCAWITPRQADQAYYMLPSRFWELATGAGLYLMGTARREALVRRFGHSTLALLGLALVALALAAAQKQAFPWPWALPAVLGSALLILAVSVPAAREARWLAWLASAPMVRIGLWSYSLYLWHWPVYTLMRWTVGLHTPLLWLLAVAISVVCAVLSFRFIEQPVARASWLARLPSLGVVALGCLVVLTARWAALQVFGLPQVFKHSVVARNSGDWYPDPRKVAPEEWGAMTRCASQSIAQDGFTAWKAVDCHDVDASSAPQIFVLGDSHAGAYRRLMEAMVRIRGSTVHVASRGGCSVAGLLRPAVDAGDECQAFRARSVHHVMNNAKPGDFVFLASLRVQRFSDQWGPIVPEARASGESDLAARNAEGIAVTEAHQLIARLESAGLQVIVDLPKPVLPAPPFRCSDAFNRMNPVCTEGLMSTRARQDAHRAHMVKLIRDLASAHQNVRVWDPLPALCEGDICAALDRHGRPLFFDADHLSGHGNDRLVRSFLQVLDSSVH